MKILLLAASLRKDSINKKLINLVAKLFAKESKINVNLVEFSEFDVPLYNGDIEDNEGIPSGAVKFIKRLQAVDGLIIASPEYNFSIPGTLKNLLDWISRYKPIPWAEKPVLLISASPSLAGGSRGLLHTRVSLEVCGAYVFPKMFSLANAYEVFNSQGALNDKELQMQLQQKVTAFLHFVKQLQRG
jgi:chromate reductase